MGNTIHWVDLATSTTPSRWEMTRIDSATFTIGSFAKLADESPSDADKGGTGCRSLQEVFAFLCITAYIL